ncbi:MAG: phosphoribosylformylglycinamidine synthase subunit PurS [Caulobacteraceae bacterium]
MSADPAGVHVRVHVALKAGVLDVQGKAVEAALHGLGWPEVSRVRVGRLIEFDVSGDDPEIARAKASAMCDRLLANPVIESWRVEV